MPNGVRRQRNTRHANRQRNIQRANEVRAHPVEDAPVVQAEVAEETYSSDEAEEYIRQRFRELSRPLLEETKKLSEKYEMLKSGTLLAFQEVEIEELQKEIEELKEENYHLKGENQLFRRNTDHRIISEDNDGVTEFIQGTFMKVWNEGREAQVHVNGRKFIIIPDNAN